MRPKRIAPIVFLACLAVTGGCLGSAGPTATEVPDRCADSHSTSPLPVPDPPASLTNETASSYVSNYTRVTTHNDLIDSNADVSVGFSARVANRTRDGFVVVLKGGSSYRRCEPPTARATSDYEQTYFINDTVFVRVGYSMNYSRSPIAQGEVLEEWTDD